MNASGSYSFICIVIAAVLFFLAAFPGPAVSGDPNRPGWGRYWGGLVPAGLFFCTLAIILTGKG